MAPAEKAAGLPPPRKPLPLSIILALHPYNVDSFLAHLHRCLQTPAGIDTVLLLLCYTSRLSASVLDIASTSPLQTKARQLLARLVSTVSASAKEAAVSAPAPNPTAVRVSASLRALSALLSDVRTFMRLWGLLGIYLRGKQLIRKEFFSTEGPGLGPVDRVIAWSQLTTGLAFQSLENVAYLSSKGVLWLTPQQQMKAIVWSTRFWAAATGIELGRLLVERTRREGASSGEVKASEEHRRWRAEWASAFVRNLAWAPLTVHWSMEKGFVNDTMIGVLATVPGVIQISKLWADTA